MTGCKLGVTIVIAALLAGCAESAYRQALKEEEREGRIVCEYERPLGSTIKQKTCRVVSELSREEKEDVLRTFEQNRVMKR